MTSFEYRAYDAQGRIATGIIEANDEKDALDAIRRRGLFPFETGAVTTGRISASWLTTEIGGNKLGLRDRALFARSVAALLKAGVPLDRALAIISSDNTSSRLAKAAQTVREKVVAGASFSDALRQIEGFRPEEAGLVNAGEQAGQVAAATEDLSRLLDERAKLRARVVSQLTYPIILLIVAAASLGVIATVLLPNVAPVFEQTGRPLPIALRMLSAIQATVSAYPIETAIFVALTCLVGIMLVRTDKARSTVETLAYFSASGRKAVAARFCRVLGTLLKNGADLQSALRLTMQASASHNLKREGQIALDEVTTGRKLSHALARISALDPQALQLIAIGEETNKLDDMLLHIAQDREVQVAQRVESLVQLMTPLLTILIGLMIGGLIVSVMRAILSLNELAL